MYLPAEEGLDCVLLSGYLAPGFFTATISFLWGQHQNTQFLLHVQSSDKSLCQKPLSLQWILFHFL